MQFDLAGQPLHTRSLTVAIRCDPHGLWRVRGDVIDLRKSGFVPMLVDLQPAGIIHLMKIELVVDPATRRLEAIEVDQPVIAIEAASATGGDCCRTPGPRLLELVGETLDAGFPKRLSAKFGGALGCSHLLTLFQVMASAVPRALEYEAELQASNASPRKNDEQIFQRSVFIDGSLAKDDSFGVGAQLADHHTTPFSLVDRPLERLALASEVRLETRVRMPDLALERLAAATRERSHTTLATADWIDCSERLAGLVGTPIMGGLAGRLFETLGDSETDRQLLDCALQLAPGFIQVMAAIADRYFGPARVEQDSAKAEGRSEESANSESEKPESAKPEDAASQNSRPPATGLGGKPDSCFMWRTGGPLSNFREALRSDAAPLDSAES